MSTGRQARPHCGPGEPGPRSIPPSSGCHQAFLRARVCPSGRRRPTASHGRRAEGALGRPECFDHVGRHPGGPRHVAGAGGRRHVPGEGDYAEQVSGPESALTGCARPRRPTAGCRRGRRSAGAGRGALRSAREPRSPLRGRLRSCLRRRRRTLASLGFGHVAQHLFHVLTAPLPGGTTTRSTRHLSAHTPQGIRNAPSTGSRVEEPAVSSDPLRTPMPGTSRTPGQRPTCPGSAARASPDLLLRSGVRTSKSAWSAACAPRRPRPSPPVLPAHGTASGVASTGSSLAGGRSGVCE